MLLGILTHPLAGTDQADELRGGVDAARQVLETGNSPEEADTLRLENVGFFEVLSGQNGGGADRDRTGAYRFCCFGLEAKLLRLLGDFDGKRCSWRIVSGDCVSSC